jgi:hypothetical protein
MESGSSLPCSQKLATCRYPEKLLHIINNQIEFGWPVKFFCERVQNFENFFILLPGPDS